MLHEVKWTKDWPHLFVISDFNNERLSIESWVKRNNITSGIRDMTPYLDYPSNKTTGRFAVFISKRVQANKFFNEYVTCCRVDLPHTKSNAGIEYLNSFCKVNKDYAIHAYLLNSEPCFQIITDKITAIKLQNFLDEHLVDKPQIKQEPKITISENISLTKWPNPLIKI